ncbi:sugar phosphate isomerase/epimerase family protein [Blastococcus sp. SYSU DS0669]
MTQLGMTLFSLTPLWRGGADAVGLLEQVAAAGCGPAVELIGHQAWRGFPAVAPEDERAFRDAVERLELTPVALGVYTDLFRRPGRPMTVEQAFDDIAPQLAAAARLGFPVVRATLGMSPELLGRVAAEAERLGVVLTFEVQGATTPGAPAVLELVELQRRTGTPFLGLTIDSSLSTSALPSALGMALRRLGLAAPEVTAVHQAWAQGGPIGPRIGSALAVVAGHPREAELAPLVAGVLGRCGRTEPEEWAELLPLVRHAHAKFWDTDVEAVRGSHGAWLRALSAAGYEGAVLSEWGGHELLERDGADPIAVSAAHVALLSELAGARTAVTA